MSDDAIRVDGLRQFGKDLKAIDPALAVELKAIHGDVADDVLQVARGLVPHVSGALLGSLRVGATLRSATVKAGKARVPYAGPIHFGWVSHHIAGKPFLFDALERRRDQAQDLYADRLAVLCDKVFNP